MKRFTVLMAAVVVVIGGVASVAQADTTIVNDTFDSYTPYDQDTSQTTFHANWRPDNGDGLPSMFSDPRQMS